MGSIENIFKIFAGSVEGGFTNVFDTIKDLVGEGFGSAK